MNEKLPHPLLSTNCWEALVKMSEIYSRSLSENVCVRFEHLLLFDKRIGGLGTTPQPPPTPLRFAGGGEFPSRKREGNL
jgi:hypothetical protein